MKVSQIRAGLFAMFLSIHCSFANEADVLTLAISSEESTPAYKFFDLYYSELFSRIGLEVTLEYFPSARAREQGNQYRVDGQAARSISYESITTHQIRVPEVVVSVSFAAYAKLPALYDEIYGWDSFKDTSLKVEYQRGATVPSQKLKEVIPAEQLSSVTRILQGLQKLNAGRSDIFVGAEVLVVPYLHNPEFKSIYRVTRLGSDELYLYLSDEHKSLIAPLANEIKNIKEEGMVEEFLAQTSLDID
ncbi:transporter substrate-binding domain-containing protein [Vibrio sp. JC009]|uniref:transporter substrate-binding domain-containing protein n=1 Tax=Vibrio sp. JC009 TaxID=2912314 RepID=UPI0023AE9C08|nr:transporter substrate-binding domain-containing protein [Vibrio sp. JC009]WED20536.1 transporter substrate-binding domain-containing protein [Vibrio sp. JC009]